MNQPAPLSNVADVVAALGGVPGLVALGYNEPQVRMWLSRGAFSNPVKPRIYVECIKRGIGIAPELVGLDQESAA